MVEQPFRWHFYQLVCAGLETACSGPGNTRHDNPIVGVPRPSQFLSNRLMSSTGMHINDDSLVSLGLLEVL